MRKRIGDGFCWSLAILGALAIGAVTMPNVPTQDQKPRRDFARLAIRDCPVPRPYMMAFGDSKTYGNGFGSNTSPLQFLDRRMKLDAGLGLTWWVGSQNNGFAALEAYPGITAETMAARIGPALDAYSPDIVLIDLGTNDANTVDGDVIVSRLAAVLDQALARPCVRVSIALTSIYWGYPLAGARLQYANSLVPAMVAAKNQAAGATRVRVVDLQPLEVARGHYAPDRLHLSAAGNEAASCYWYYAGVAPWIGSGRLPASACPVYPVEYQG